MNVLIVPVYIRKVKEIAMLRKLVSLAESDPGIDHVIIVDDCELEHSRNSVWSM
jgi:hypothetical protein